MSNEQIFLTKPQPYEVSKYRFVVSIIYFFSQFSCSMMLTSFNPILTDLQTIYGGVDLFALTFCTSLISPVTFPFVNLIANYFNDEFGMKVGISIANILMVIGYIFRVFLVNGVAYIFIGQALASIAMPFVLNSPQKISGLWFSPQERALATTCLSLANFAGMAAGFVLPSFYLTGTTNPETQSLSDEVTQMVTDQAYAAIPILLISIFFFKSKPKVAPNPAAKLQKYNYKQSLETLFKYNHNFLLYGVSTGLTWATFSSAGTVLQPLITPAGYTVGQIGIYGIAIIGCGVLGALIFGKLAGRTRKYKKIIIIILICSTSILAIMIPLGIYYHPILAGIGLAIYGFTTMPFFAIAFEYSCELTFPVAEASAAGVMTTCTQVFHITLTYIIDGFIGVESDEGTLLGTGCLFLTSFIGLLGQSLTKQELRRQKAENAINSDEKTSE